MCENKELLRQNYQRLSCDTLSLSHLCPNSKMNTGRCKPSFYHMSQAAKACQPTFPLKTSKSLSLFFSYERLLLDLRRVCTSCSLVWDRSHDFLPPWKTRCVDVRFPLIAAVLGLLGNQREGGTDRSRRAG